MNKTIKSYWAWGIIAVLSLILLFLCHQLWREYRHNARAEFFSSKRASLETLLSHQKPLTIANTSYIQTWMTFDYINTIFKLSPTYLQTALAITDTHYPHISIVHYAHENKMTSAVFLAEVKNAIASSSAPMNP